MITINEEITNNEKEDDIIHPAIPVTSEVTIPASVMQDVNIPEAIMQNDKAPETVPFITNEDVKMMDDKPPEPMYDEDDDEDDQQNSMSSQVIAEYRTLMQMFDPGQTVFRLLDDHDDIISLFPDLLLYTAPDCDSIGNDPYFDEAEYNRIVPFKLSTQRLVLQKRSRKRNSDGQHIYQRIPDEEENVKVLPRHERYDCTPQLSRKLFNSCT